MDGSYSKKNKQTKKNSGVKKNSFSCFYLCLFCTPQQNYSCIPVFLHITDPTEKVNSAMSVCSPRQDVHVNGYQRLSSSKND